MVFPLNLPGMISSKTASPAAPLRCGPGVNREGICTPYALTLSPEVLARVPVNVGRLLQEGRVLVVTADDTFAAQIENLSTDGGKLKGRARSDRLRTVTEAAQALHRLCQHRKPVDLVICDARLRDGRAGELIGAIAEWQPQARLIVSSDKPTLDEALGSVREGAIDYLPRPIEPEMLRRRLTHAAGRQYLEFKTDRRLVRLKRAVRQLNTARRAVGRKVDLLCTDLVGAYGELSKQMEQVRVGEHLRELLASSADLEQMLCHLMDWLLRELGNCNIAIFLTDDESRSELAAYMKYTILGDDATTRELLDRVVPPVRKRGSLSIRPADKTMPAKSLLGGQHVVGVDCTYLAESLGTLVVFRDDRKGFDGDAISLVSAAARVFALVLTNLVREQDSESAGAADHADEDAGASDEWWRTGEDAPF